MCPVYPDVQFPAGRWYGCSPQRLPPHRGTGAAADLPRPGPVPRGYRDQRRVPGAGPQPAVDGEEGVLGPRVRGQVHQKESYVASTPAQVAQI